MDIMRVHEGVRRLRRKSSGLATKETIGAIVEARQPGERSMKNGKCFAINIRGSSEKASQEKEARKRNFPAPIFSQREAHVRLD